MKIGDSTWNCHYYHRIFLYDHGDKSIFCLFLKKEIYLIFKLKKMEDEKLPEPAAVV